MCLLVGGFIPVEGKFKQSTLSSNNVPNKIQSLSGDWTFRKLEAILSQDCFKTYIWEAIMLLHC